LGQGTTSPDEQSPLRQAVYVIRKLESQLEAMRRERTEPLAIIGLGCRFPGGGDDPRAYWELLRGKTDAVTEVPRDRWDLDRFYDPDPEAPGKIYSRYGAFLAGVDQFDPQFFGIAPREAVGLDPQHRLLLEVSWEALEHAGCVPATLAGVRAGVFVGIGPNDYGQLSTGDYSRVDAYAGTGNGICFAAGRLAHVLGFRGPAVTLDTACSSSLVSTHLAVQSLRNGECDLALAGGVSLMLGPQVSIFLSRARALSPDGRCKTFDAAADGYVRGEGCGMVVLKRLSDALANGDNILALIRGSAVNHDGHSSGLTVPNGPAQQQVIRQALAAASVKPADVDFVEAHGTGTSLGDPIEVEALGDVFGRDRPNDRPLLIGSVKTNIGHLEAAAGIASLIKVVLALEHGEIPPHPHLRQLNPHVRWDEIAVEVPTECTPWPATGRRLAGVSSFGLSGTNAHVVLEQAPPKPAVPAGVERPFQLLTLSAKSAEALDQLARRYADYLRTDRAAPLTDICFTAGTGRSHFSRRLAVLAASREQLREKLADLAAGGQPAGAIRGSTTRATPPKVGFLFTGQGSQYAGMGRELFDTESTFRSALERCDACLRPLLPQPLLDVLFPPPGGTSPINETAYAQPALFALEYALVALWAAWGVKPSFVMGHSVGEYVAACVAGVFSLEDGLRLIAQRGRLMQQLPRGGRMVAVMTDEAGVAQAMRQAAGRISLAAVNAPRQVVISGAAEAVDAAVRVLQSTGVRTTELVVSHAFHSALMEPMLEPFARVARDISFAQPKLPVVSNVTGELAGQELGTPGYWVEHVRRPVRFSRSLTTLANGGCEAFLEIGPNAPLLALGRQCLPDHAGPWLPSLRSKRSDWEQLLESLAQLHVHGASVDWHAVYRDVAPAKVPLPTYPFQRRRYWVSGTGSDNHMSLTRESERGPALHPLLESRVESPFLSATVFASHFSAESPAFLKDHRVFGRVVVPGACHLSMALAAAQLALHADSCVLEDVHFPQALALAEGGSHHVQLAIVPEAAAGSSFKIVSRDASAQPPDRAWMTHAHGRLSVDRDVAGREQVVSVEELTGRCREEVDSTRLYDALRARQVDLGPSFQWIGRAWRGRREAVCQMQLPATVSDADRYQLHPGLVDGCFQLLAIATGGGTEETFVPTRVGQFRYWARPGQYPLWCHARLADAEQADERTVAGDIRLLDQSGHVLVEIRGLEARRVERSLLLGEESSGPAQWVYELAWPPAPSPLEASDAASGEPGSWLLLADGGDVAAGVAARLNARRQSCVRVARGDAYARTAPDRFVVNPSRPEDYRRLLEELAASDLPPLRGVAHFGSLDVAVPGKSTTSAMILEQQLIGCGGALHLAQAIALARGRAHPRLWLFTRGAQAVGTQGADCLNAAQATVWGLARTIAVEHPELRCTRVDLSAVGGDEDAAEICFRELWSPDGEDQVAYRDGTRHVARLKPRLLEPARTGLPVSADGNYLITGGLGALGLRVAQWLVAKGARHLVLTGRRGVTSEEQRRELAALESAGARVTVVEADVAQPRDMARLWRTLESTPAALRGVVHAAGVLDDGALHQLTWERFGPVMAPKVAGAWNLHLATVNTPLDFFVSFSSVASVMGSPGQGNYAAANAFLDALAHVRTGQGLPALSVNWGAWGGSGMAAARSRRDQARSAALGLGTIDPDQGLALLDQLCRQHAAQLVVVPLNRERFFREFAVGQEPCWSRDLASSVRRERQGPSEEELQWLHRVQAAPPAERHKLLVAYLQDLIGGVLGLDPSQPPDPLQGFFNLGMDSLMSIELRNRLQTTLGLTLPFTLAFEYSTIEELAGYLAKELPGRSPTAASDSLERKRGEQLPAVSEIDSLSREELDASINEELAGLEDLLRKT